MDWIHGTSIGGVIVDAGNFNWVMVSSPVSELSEGYHGLKFWEVFELMVLSKHYRNKGKGRRSADYGPALSPFNAFLLLEGLETLTEVGQNSSECP